MEVKIINYHTSLALGLPKDNRFKEGQNWLLIPSADGESFTLAPKTENPYNKTKGSKIMTEEWSDFNCNEVK
ncbi:transcription elongation factor GreAB [Lactiplantibacillus sp. WILCCON 0030]|uniref:Transcription elongation factor GreAB n=1 Tax=Lactiplantibacillus brownii TaxID=3069269 RepID=A0ABU1ABA8_9LACO|nr:transcription elongation factor GreAB [Lactiplantibacillus brownii]MDQ7937610.1 transcription elongation factor GreAB [Lactiplantibacillus brownii]